MPIDPNTPHTNADERLAQRLADMERRLAALEQLARKIAEAAGL